jgi:serine/threonine-protein kinase RsbW/stage II sporulation protein AB (anti-sigma F factor)
VTSDYEQTWPAEIGSVAPARNGLVGFAEQAGIGGRLLTDVRLAVSEAATNAVVHGYVDRPVAGSFTIEAHVHRGRFVVVVSDEGGGMVPRPDSPGLGLGLPIIAQMTESLEIREPADRPGVQVHMVFALPGALH